MGMMAGTVHSGCLSYAAILKDGSFAAQLSYIMDLMAEVSSQQRDAPVEVPIE